MGLLGDVIRTPGSSTEADLGPGHGTDSHSHLPGGQCRLHDLPGLHHGSLRCVQVNEDTPFSSCPREVQDRDKVSLFCGLSSPSLVFCQLPEKLGHGVEVERSRDSTQIGQGRARVICGTRKLTACGL